MNNGSAVRRDVVGLFSVTRPTWETASTANEPWPRGWFTAPVTVRLRCCYDRVLIRPLERLYCTGREGEVYCAEHAHVRG